MEINRRKRNVFFSSCARVVQTIVHSTLMMMGRGVRFRPDKYHRADLQSHRTCEAEEVAAERDHTTPGPSHSQRKCAYLTSNFQNDTAVWNRDQFPPPSRIFLKIRHHNQRFLIPSMNGLP